MRTVSCPAELAEHAGTELGVTPWRRIDQPLVDGFARETGDQQWIHVDPDRARRGPFGGTVAHGFLVLSMVPRMIDDVLCVQGTSLVLNKEIRRARFLAPVPVGSRVRATVSLTAARSRPHDFWEAEFLVSAELEGVGGVAVTAQSVLLYQ